MNESLVKNFAPSRSNGKFSFEKLAPIEKYPDYNLEPDFYIDRFYLTDSLFASIEQNFAGNHIQVVNSFIPGQLENFNLYYATKANVTNPFSTTENIIRPQTISLFGGMAYDVQYNKLYRNLVGPNTPVLIVNGGIGLGGFTFTHNTAYSTPIIVLLSRDLRAVSNESFAPDRFIFTYSSPIATANHTSIIDTLHGFQDGVDIAVYSDTVVNPITVTIEQRDRLGQLFTDATLNPTSSYHSQVSLPQRNSGAVRVTINGGGAGESGEIDIVVIIKKPG